MENWIPDVVVMDWCLPQMDGFECMEQIQEKHPKAKFVCITGEGNWNTFETAKEKGAGAMMSKPFTGPELSAMVWSVLDAEESDRVTLRMMPTKPTEDAYSGCHAFGLTVRECAVMDCLRIKMTDKKIAIHMGISQHTVASHLANIFHKVACSSREEAVRKCFCM
jgi:DNA-binding NarL/FixJ family response regulator